MAFRGFIGSVFIASSLLLSGCTVSVGSGNDGGGGGEKPVPPPPFRVNWAAVPSDYHPETKDIPFQTGGFEKIDIRTPDSDRDTEIIYSPTLAKGSGFLRVFSVWAKSASFPNLEPVPAGRTLKVEHSNGMYQCMIHIQNGQITELEGGCYVRQQLFLPTGSEIEVYNRGKLLSQRFIPMTVEAFLEQLDDAIGTDSKMKAIDDFLGSYTSLGKTPIMTSEQLGKAIGEFSFKEEKFTVLRRLHSFVSNREDLGRMIDDKFGTFDRAEARRIAGL